jgi:hypothetical protein
VQKVDPVVQLGMENNGMASSIANLLCRLFCTVNLGRTVSTTLQAAGSDCQSF